MLLHIQNVGSNVVYHDWYQNRTTTNMELARQICLEYELTTQNVTKEKIVAFYPELL